MKDKVKSQQFRCIFLFEAWLLRLGKGQLQPFKTQDCLRKRRILIWTKLKVGTEFFKINDLISVYCNNFKMCVSCTYSMKMINRRERKKVKARILVYLR